MRKFKTAFLGFIAILGLLAVAAQAQQDYSAWQFGKRITLNTSAVGVGNTVNNFPVLIRLNSSNFNFSQANSSGNDVRFASEDNTPLNYEIERWDAGAQVAEIWVLVPSIPGNATTPIRMYWGNNGAASESNSEAVFNTSNNFQAVWHLGENGNNNAGGYLDATNNNLHGTGGSMTSDSDVPGAVGVGQRFDGGADYIDIPNSASGPLNFSSVTGPYTLSAWVNTDALNGNHRPIIMKGDNQYGLKVFTNDNVELFRKDNGWNFVRAAPPGAGQWIHVVGNYNGTLQNLYLNGALRNDSTDATDTGDPVQSFNVNLGRNSEMTNRFWIGILDEVRMSNVARSADWVRLSYENQRPSGQNFAVMDASRPPVDLSYSQGEVLQYTMGQAITDNTISYKGDAATSFNISPTPPQGLGFDTQTGTLSGTPTTATPAAAYTVTVTNGAGTDSIILNITVVGPPTNLAYSEGTDLTYIAGQAIDTNFLSFDNGPASSITISPSSSFPLQFNSVDGSITGTPQSRLDPTDFIVTVTNDVDQAQITLSVEVLEAPSINGYSQDPPYTYLVGDSIVQNDIIYEGSPADSFTITPGLPPGLNFNSSSGSISGVPTASRAAQDYTVTAHNGAGTDAITLNIGVLWPISDVSYTQTTNISYVVMTTVNNELTFTGDPLTSTNVTPPLPEGLSVNDSGDIVGTPTAATPQANYTVTLTNAAGSVEVPFTITITSSATEPSNVNYTDGPTFTWSEGDSVNTGSINFDGTQDASVQVTLSSSSPALPEGLSLDASTGAITGRPTAESASQEYTIIVSNSGGQDSVTITIAVTVPPPSNLRYSNERPLISYLVGQPIVPNELNFDGGQTIVGLATTPEVLPGGLSIDSTTGIISGTPTTVTPPRDYTITITNAGGSESITLIMEVVDESGATAPSGLVYELGNTMQFVVNRPIIPNPLIYSGTEATNISINPDLQTNTGLQIDGLSGTISGTPTTVAAPAEYTVLVVNAAGQAQLSINLGVVTDAIAPTSPRYSEGTDLDYIVDTTIVTNRLSYSGTQATSVSINPPLPEGLKLDTLSGAISGTPTAVSSKRDYQVNITNPGGNISLTISLGVTEQQSTVEASISKPQANSTLGNPLVSYTLTGAVQSGTVTWENGQLPSGDPVPDANNNQVATLTGAALTSGSHTNIALTGLNLLRGARYDVRFDFVDPGGASFSKTVRLVRLSNPLSGLRISPDLQEFRLEESVNFQAVGLEVVEIGGQFDTNEVSVSPVSWTSVDGRGSIDSNGSFTPLSLGRTRVSAHFGALTDTATVNFTSATASLPAGGDTTVVVGQTIQIVLPVMTSFAGSNLAIAQLASAAIPQGMVVAGPGITQQLLGFEEPVTYRLRVDPSVAGTPNVYRQASGGGWELIPSTREGDWLAVALDTTATLLVGVDVTPPTINLVNAASQRAGTQGQGMNVNLTASDNIANPTVNLVITTAGSENRLPVNFRGNNQETVYNIEGSHIGRLGLFYHLEISDGTSTVTSDTVDVLVTVTDSLSSPGGLALNGYDMFSIPMKPKVATVSGITSDSDWPDRNGGVEWRLFGWENNAYAEKTETSQLAPGAAYFVRTNAFSPALNFASESMESLPYSSPYEIPLSTNWNVFGNPFMFPVDLASIQAVNQELEYFYLFENQTFRILTSTEAVEPWKGYLVWNGTPAKRATLSIPGIIANASLAKRPVEQVAGLTLESPSEKDGYLQFGVSGGLDGHPKPNLVPGGLRVWLQSDKGKVMTDYRPRWEEGQRFTLGLSYKPGNAVRLVFHDVYRLGEGLGVRLVSKKTGEVYKVENGAVALSGPVESELEMLVGSPEYLEKETQNVLLEKRTLFLGQNVPNPFKTSTSIRYQVPGLGGEWRNVRLEIFDLQGRRIKSLVDQRALPGDYRVQWDGAGDRGTILPSGAYFYRLSIDGERQLQKKLILLK